MRASTASSAASSAARSAPVRRHRNGGALAVLAALVLAGTAVAGCGNPLYAPCGGQLDCGADLRCVDLGNNQRMCTRPCTTTKRSAGLPDGFENNDLFDDGANAQREVVDPQCGDAAINITSEDSSGERGQNIAVESAGVVGVCRISAEQLANNAISGDSVLSGFCTPL